MNRRHLREDGATDLVVVHTPSEDIQEIKAIKKCSDLAWSASISQCLQSRGFDFARDCQTVTWPAITHINSLALFCVAGPKQGKTAGQVFYLQCPKSSFFYIKAGCYPYWTSWPSLICTETFLKELDLASVSSVCADRRNDKSSKMLSSRHWNCWQNAQKSRRRRGELLFKVEKTKKAPFIPVRNTRSSCRFGSGVGWVTFQV